MIGYSATIRSFAAGLFAIAGLAAATMSSAQAQAIGLAASNPGSLYHSSATAIAKVANDNAGLQATVQPFASATIYLPAVAAGEYAFGLTNVEELRVAVAGDRWYEGRKYEDLRAVGIMYPLRNGIFVRADSDIKSMADLKGKRMVTGFTSQKTIPPIIDAVLATAGLTQADIVPVQVPNVVAGANAFVEGKADAFIFAHGAAKVREADASVGGIRSLPIPNTPENLATIQKYFPPAYLKEETAGKNNPGVTDPIHVLTYDAVVAASTKTPDDVVYRLVKAMHENKAAMAGVFPVFNLFDPNRMNSDLSPIQWHPGAVKFYKEAGLWTEMK
ncbi:MAG TPA: TAXI family TRAP transporter solute-binding subunit [Hyphomicrobiales bacterium]|nr:TAXI family TRAP transporter solute-binding subunit [Hyphomicrobiales bacterium]